MRARLRWLGILAVWLFPTALTIDLTSCNDGSTGCCVICPDCACGSSCVSCAVRCTMPKGCACSSNPTLRASLIDTTPTGPMSVPPDGGDEP